MVKGTFGRGSKSAKGGSKSAVTPASSRRQKISMNLQFAPLIDQISVPVLGRVVVTIVGVECLKKCPVMVKVGLSRFQKPDIGIGKRVPQMVRKTSGKFI